MTILFEQRDELLNLARKAGEAILKLYNQSQPLDVKLKENQTPVTEADLVANDIIRDGFKQINPRFTCNFRRNGASPF